ncbi:ribonuclease Z [archaeon]|nr:ribonuclease Z [archaeon]
MKVTFLGTNGWFTNDNGYTASILVETSKEYIFLDAGTGFFRSFEFLKENKPISLLLSHFHLDHIVGLPVIQRSMRMRSLDIYGQENTEKNLKTIINTPFYPRTLDHLPLTITINELQPGRHKNNFTLECAFLDHSDTVYGYRIEADGKVLTYCADTKPCENAVKLARHADLLIQECNHRTGIKSKYHCNPEDAALIAKKAKAKKLALTHFSPVYYKTLEDRDHAEKVAKKIFPKTIASRDLMEIEV